MTRIDPRAIAQLGPEHNVPLNTPFDRVTALGAGVSDRHLGAWTQAGLLCRPLRGVYYVAQIRDTLALRVACLKLIVPEDAVVTDRTAAWLHGAPRVLAPGDHLTMPRAHIFLPPGRRLRNKLAASGERTFLPEDLMLIDGLWVTTPLRTCWDVGRLLTREDALSVMDSLQRMFGFTLVELADGLPRFKGERGVVQLRELVLLVDGRSQSPGESVLRLRWLDAGLPPGEPQLVVAGPTGVFYLDLGLIVLRFAAEYDGEEFHGEEQREADESRRSFLRREGGWVIVVARKRNVYGPRRDIDGTLVREYHEARRTLPSRLSRVVL